MTPGIPQPEIEQVQHPILGPLKFPKEMPYDQRNQIVSDMENERNLNGPDDPTGTYDFGDLGKVQGMKTNGRPATRQEAARMLADQRGFTQTMGETFQRKRQDISNFIQSSTDTDKATKGFMGDLAGMLVGAGMGKLSTLGRSGGAALPDAMRLAPNALEQQTNPAPKLTVDQLLKQSMDALDKKYPGTRAAWEASKQEAPQPTQDIVGLLQKSIAAAKSKK